MKTVKIVLSNGENVIIRNCSDYYFENEEWILVVCKNNGDKLFFNVDFVQYIGYLEDFEGGKADE